MLPILLTASVLAMPPAELVPTPAQVPPLIMLEPKRRITTTSRPYCKVGGCGVALEESKDFCARHWYVLPATLKRQVLATKPGGAARERAVGKALAWLEERERQIHHRTLKAAGFKPRERAQIVASHMGKGN